MSVLPTTTNNPGVNVAKSDLARFGLTRSNTQAPGSVLTASLVEWRRKVEYPTNADWRSGETLETT